MSMNCETAVAEAARKARRANACDVVAELNATNRTRALTTEESDRLTRAIYATRKVSERQRYYWTGEMDRELLAMLGRKTAFKVIAATIGVTPKAAEMRAWRLRRSGEIA